MHNYINLNMNKIVTDNEFRVFILHIIAIYANKRALIDRIIKFLCNTCITSIKLPIFANILKDTLRVFYLTLAQMSHYCDSRIVFYRRQKRCTAVHLLAVAVIRRVLGERKRKQ